jgi:hypothetical protein
MKRIFDTLIVAMLIFSSAVLVVQVVQAQNENSLDSKAKERLDKIEKKLATDSSDKSTETKVQKTQGKHVTGTITSINNTNILIDNKRSIQQVLTNSETTFLQISEKAKTTITLKDLKIGDRVAVYGLSKDESNGAAEAVVKLTKPLLNRHAIFGKITLVNGSSLTITHIQQDRVLGTVVVNNSTLIRGKDVSLTAADLKAGDIIAASGTVDSKGVITAKKIFVVPGKGLQKSGTSSATPSAR